MLNEEMKAKIEQQIELTKNTPTDGTPHKEAAKDLVIGFFKATQRIDELQKTCVMLAQRCDEQLDTIRGLQNDLVRLHELLRQNDISF